MARRGGRTKLDQVVQARLGEIYDVFTSGASALTGQIRREYGREGEVIGRFGGVKKSYRELAAMRESPSQIAAAIRKGSGPLYQRVYNAVEEEFAPDYSRPRRSAGRPTVLPHDKLRSYCETCQTLHTKGAHRFHGEGSYHRTHLWGFKPFPALNPMPVNNATRTFSRLMALARKRRLTDDERKRLTMARQQLRRGRRPAMNARKSGAPLEGPWIAQHPERDPRSPYLLVVKSGAGITTFGLSNREAIAEQRRGVPFLTDEEFRKLVPEFGQNPRSPKPKRVKCSAKGCRERAMVTVHGKPYCVRCAADKAGLFGHKRNPPAKGKKRIGKCVEIRYNRDQGKHRGFYKHTFKSRPNVYILPDSGAILIEP